jgi:tetratricopeptide (TPR) repeat protein
MPQVKELLEDGKKRLAKGDWKGASHVFGEAVDMLEDLATSTEERTILAELLRRKGHADARIGELQDAMAQVKEALEISETLEDNFGEADALRGLGYIYWQKGDVPMALEFYDLALDKANACASQELVGRIKIEIANAYNTKGDRARAKETYQQAISILRSVGSMNELARAYNTTIKGWAAFNAAECFTQMGETKFAKEYLRMALEFLTLSDDRIGIASTLKIMGVTYCAERDWPLAEETFNKSLAIIKDIEMPGLEGDILISVAKMWLARGHKEKTEEVLKTAIALLEEGNRKKNADEARKILATL